MKIIKKRVSLVVDSLSGGGSQRVCVNVANGLTRLGWEVDLLLLNLNDSSYFNNLSKKVNIIKLNTNHSRYAFVPLIKYILKNKPKIFIVYNYELTVLLVILKKIFKFKIKILARNSNSLSLKIIQLQKKNYWSKYFVNPLIKFFFHKADHILNQCNGMKEDFLELFPKEVNKVSVIFNPISLQIFDFIKNNGLNNIEKEDYILYVGRLEQQKSVHYAIEAFAKISKKYPSLRLKILGQGNLKKELEKTVLKNNINDRVDFEGFKKNIIPYYVYAKATILTSLFEGFPNCLIESISLGTPVVSFDCPNGPREIIINGINGYLAKYKDSEDLKVQLLNVLSHKFSIREMNFTMKKFNPDEISKSYERLLNLFI